MKTRTAACAALLALTAALTACSTSSDTKADPAACKAAMRKQFQDAIAAGDTATPSTRPPQCNGVDAKTLQKFAADLMTDQLGKSVESAFPDDTETSNITADCRAWIEKELEDSSDSIDATAGYEACGYMSKDELDKAIDTVTNDLMSATPSP
ncbi:hypothetical protein [Streptomyces sp. NPDC094149]|uniref:hypothetical protein n=1 Tax=Streptomyces sp. NPDC094149 TaxID=3155079 RepID=UPI003333ECD1